MTIDKIKELEPLFDSWYVDGKISQGRNMDIFKVYRNFGGDNEYMALKTIKFPRSDKELSTVIDSGKFKTIDEYLNTLEKMVRENMDKMMDFRTCPNIVRFDNYTIIKERSCFYVVMLMQLVTPLTDYLKNDMINVRQVCKISADLCQALSVFRQFGIMHKEVKHENIYVNSTGDYLLGDFGITTAIDTEFKIKEESTYTAPELYDNVADTNSDIYSLGILMYKFLNNNRVPFLPDFPAPISLADRQAAFQRRISGEAMPTPVNADPRLSAIILKACSFNPNQRYQNPQQLKAELLDYINFINVYGATKVTTAAPVQQPIEKSVPIAPVPTSTAVIPKIDTEQIIQKPVLQQANEVEESQTDNKKAYALIIGLAAVLVVIVSFLFNSLSTNDIEVEEADGQTALEVSIVDTTAEVVIETTTAVTTQTTSETTTETTTQAPIETTEATTVAATTPVLVESIFEAGDTSYNGKSYYEISEYTVSVSTDGDEISKIVLTITDPLGSGISMNDGAYIYAVSNSGIEFETTATVSTKIDYGVSAFGLLSQLVDGLGLSTQTMTCTIEIDSDSFTYDPDSYDYYLTFELGTFESDDYLSLPIQIELD